MLRLAVALAEGGAAVLAGRGEGQGLGAAPVLAVRVGVDDRLEGGVRAGGRTRRARRAPCVRTPRRCRPAARSSVTSMPPSVRVPVLSRQTMSTRARPSMAGSSWTRHCLRPSRMTPIAKATEVSRTRPSGTIGTMPPTVRAIGVLEVVVLDDQLADDQADRGRDHHPGHVLEDRGDAGAQLGVDEREAGRLLGELGRVRLAADLRGGEGAAARDDEAAGHHRVAGLLDDRVGLAGEQRLVDLQAVGLDAHRRPRRPCRRGRSR